MKMTSPLNQGRQWLRAIHENESGAMAVEKILLIALISLPLVIGLYVFRGVISGWFSTQSSLLQTDSSSSVNLGGSP
jgi:Flp pilus assembly pilin Flp